MGRMLRAIHRRPVVTWSASLVALVMLDVWADRNDVEGDTLSEIIRELLRTETPEGRVAFLVGWAALTGWFVPHICRPQKPPQPL